MSGEDLCRMLDIGLWYAEKIQELYNDSMKECVKITGNAKKWKAKHDRKDKELTQLKEKNEIEDEERYNYESDKQHWQQISYQN